MRTRETFVKVDAGNASFYAVRVTAIASAGPRHLISSRKPGRYRILSYLCRWIFVALLFNVSICIHAQNRDLPNPMPNMQNVPAGSLVIPMDNEHQNHTPPRPFNLKAYGLINELLQNDIPVLWVIRSGKIKDAIDFSAMAELIRPAAIGAAMQDFRCGAFIIDSTWVNKSYFSYSLTALEVIDAFSNNVAVYRLTQNINVDVRYTLNRRPRVAVFNNGGNQQLHTVLLDEAGFDDYVEISAGVFNGLMQCYTFCSEPHWKSSDLSDTAITAKVRQFVHGGGNFLAQCAGIETYENNQQPPWHFHSTNGVEVVNTNVTNTYYNPDLAIMQFEGDLLSNPGGSVHNWTTLPGSNWVPEFYKAVSPSPNTDTIVCGGAHIVPVDSLGGNVTYLGGHSYASNSGDFNDLQRLNGARIYLNAALVPANRGTGFGMEMGIDQNICEGDSVMLGGNPTGPSGVVYTWTPSTGLSDPNSPNPIATPNVTTTYTLTGMNGLCPGGPLYVTITVYPNPPVPTITSNGPVCEGQTLNLGATSIPGATYSWTGPNGFTAVVQNPSIPNVTLANAGIYHVTAYINGCTSVEATVNIVVNTIPPAPVAGSNSPVCTGFTLNLTTGNIPGATYSWTGPNGFSSALQNPSITNVTLAAGGIYTVIATVNGCASAGGTVTVVVNATPVTPAAGSNSPVCTGQTLFLTAGNIPGATYIWSGPNGFSSALQNPSIPGVNLAANGIYSVIATVNGCASAAGTVTVVVNDTPVTPSTSSNSPVCTGQTLFLTAGAIPGATYNWSGPNGFSSTLQNPSIPNVTLTENGVYSLIATVNGCASAAGTTNVVINATPVTPATGSNSPVCTGQTLDLTAGNIPGAAFNWTGPNGFTSSLQNPSIPNVTLAANGVYSVTASINGCTGAAGTVTVVVNATPVITSTGSNSPVCTGQTLDLTAVSVPGATYDWTGPNGFSSALQNPSIPNVTLAENGVYSVIATINGCASASGTVSVVINATPATPAPGSNSPVCAGQTINLTTANIPGATYSWTGPNGFSSPLQNPSIFNTTLSADGIYSLIVTVNGCASAAGTVTVVVNPIPASPLASSNSPVCEGLVLDLFASNVPGASYFWTGPNGFTSAIQNPSITNVSLAAAGVYNVTATVLGCVSPLAMLTVVVNYTPAALMLGSNSPLCAGQTLILTANTIPGATFSWMGPNGFSSAQQNPVIANITPASGGSYTAAATVNGCTGPASNITVVVHDLPVAEAGNDMTIGGCLNSADALIIGSGTGSAPLLYNWSPATGLNDPTLATPYAHPSLNTTYELLVTDIFGCTATDVVTIFVSMPPMASAGTGATIGGCSNAPDAQLSGSAAGVAPFLYSWQPSATLNDPNIANPTAHPATTTTYILNVTDLYGCTASDAVTVTVDAAPTANAGSDAMLGGCADSPDATLTGSGTGIAPLSFAWSPVAGLSNPNISGPTAHPLATTVYTLMVIDNYGCTATDAITINIAAIPAAEAGADVNIGSCITSVAYLTGIAGGTPPLKYLWSPATGLDNPTNISAIAHPSTTTMYTFTVMDSYGCAASDVVLVTVNQLPVANFTVDKLNDCEAFVAHFTDHSFPAPAVYHWNFGDAPSGSDNYSSMPNPSHYFSAPGSYTIALTIVDVYGCEAIYRLTDGLHVYPRPGASFLVHPKVVTIENPVVDFIDESLGASEYDWDFGDPQSGLFNRSNEESPTHQFTEVGNYFIHLMVKNEYGCVDTASDEIIVQDVFSFYAPNAFSPNGDGVNEYFGPQLLNFDIATFEFYIYDRWGELIFTSFSPDNPWDGRAKKGRNLVQQDVYSWLVYVNEQSGKKHKFVGHVTLLK